MTDETDPTGDTAGVEPTLFPKSVGERLRDARLAQKLELSDVAQRTRVPLRHLEALENGDYSTMPTPTYAVGFAKAYARAVGEDEIEIAREIRGRAEITAARRPEFQPYETQEVVRGPSSGVVLGAVALALVLLIGVGLWFGTDLFRGNGLDNGTPAATEAAVPPAAQPTAATPAAAGQVTLVANDEVWVRIYDAAGTTLKMGTMAPGERYDVPRDANGPMINVGRPDKLQVLVDGNPVAPLGNGKVALKDVGISAAALQARGQPAPAATTTAAPAAPPAAAPTTSPTGRPSPSPSRSVPPFFRPTPQPTRTAAAPASTGQRDAPPPAATPAAVPGTTAPGNGT